jgi:hypothetical protein
MFVTKKYLKKVIDELRSELASERKESAIGFLSFVDDEYEDDEVEDFLKKG